LLTMSSVYGYTQLTGGKDAMEDDIPSLIAYFESLEDPRVVGRTSHKLIDIIVITICAVISNAETWEEVHDYGHQKEDFLRRFLDLPHGIPSHDTFCRVFGIISPDSIQTCFVEWTRSLMKGKRREVIAIDGKTARRSGSPCQSKSPLHLVSAWASEAGVVLGQEACDEKSNEITAIPKLLDVLELKGNIVTTDALGSQKAIAKQVRAGGGDYVFALKGNHKLLYEAAQSLFKKAKRQRWRGYEYDWYETTESGHGRKERRKYWTIQERPAIEDLGWFLFRKEPWPDLNVIGVVESERTINGQTSTETRYYVSSIENNAEVLAKAVRGHWGVENNLHWMLDVVFREDHDRNRSGHAQNNLSLVRKIALNLIKQEKTKKGSIKGRRKHAGWNDQYLLKILGVET